LGPYLEPRESGPKLMQWIEENKPEPGIKIVDFLVHVNQRVFNSIGYNIRMEAGVQTCEDTLTIRSGSCRDSAWMLVQFLRHLGIAARFVSGYLVQLTSDIKSLDGPSGPEADFTDLHAWAEAYVPGAGWIGLDATSGLLASEGHIPLCCTPDYASAAPVSGATDICEVTFEFDNKVFRIHEDPRVTKPYTEEQWAAVMQVGYDVEKDLQEGDVRLTMGGEPTFISIDDYESPEWNTAADGKLKRQLAYDLSLRLKNRFAHGGLMHFHGGSMLCTGGMTVYPCGRMTIWWQRKDKQNLRSEKQNNSQQSSPSTSELIPIILRLPMKIPYTGLWRKGNCLSTLIR
jgi:hypothetical protein